MLEASTHICLAPLKLIGPHVQLDDVSGVAHKDIQRTDATHRLSLHRNVGLLLSKRLHLRFLTWLELQLCSEVFGRGIADALALLEMRIEFFKGPVASAFFAIEKDALFEQLYHPLVC